MRKVAGHSFENGKRKDEPFLMLIFLLLVIIKFLETKNYIIVD